MKSFKQLCPMRLQPRRIGGITILDDSYNSNPLSMECAIRTLLEYNSGGRKIVVTSDMLELGKKSRCLHEFLGREIASSAVDILITVGPLAKYTNLGAKKGGMQDLYHTASHVDAAKFLKKTAQAGDVVLVKGSRAMKMERVIECYTTYFTR